MSAALPGPFAALLLLFVTLITPSRADDQAASRPIQEEIWALPLPLPMFAYVVRPVGDGPFPLAIMNHGVSDPDRPQLLSACGISRRRQVVCPTRLSCGGPRRHRIRRSRHRHTRAWALRPVLLESRKVQQSQLPRSRPCGCSSRPLDHRLYGRRKRILPKDVIVVGQSAGGWASIALSSLNPPQVKAIITFAAGRGGRVDGKPNNNCAPDKLVEATGEFGRTSRVPMLWIYIENDTFFGPALSKRMHEAFTARRRQGRIPFGAAVRQ